MALVAKLEASTGNITCGTVDGVNLTTLNTNVLDHDHPITGNTGSVTDNMTLTDTSSGTSFNTASDSSGTGAGYRSATASDTHYHADGSLATNVETPGAAGSAKTDDVITIDSATGDVVCDLINSIAPEVLYDKYDGHYHSMQGTTASTTLPALRPKNSSTYKYFHTASNSGGSSPYWEEITTNAGAHSHAYGDGGGRLALAAYGAPAGGGSNGPGDPKFAIAHATGNLSTEGDVNDIGISEFNNNYAAHTAHTITGTTDEHAISDAYVHGVSTANTYIEVSSGVWRRAYVRRVAHRHTGSGLSVGTPS